MPSQVRLMGSLFWVAIFFILSACLHIGTIRKDEDPILKTQTDPIAYKDKMEEIKDGEKGASMPSMSLFPKEKFLVDPPLDKEAPKQEVKEEDILSSEEEIGSGLEEDEELEFELDEELFKEDDPLDEESTYEQDL